MKKFIICAICLFASYSSFAQIHMDKVEEDGSRIIITSSKNIYKGWLNAAAVCLVYATLPEQEYETIELSLTLNEGKMQFDKGRKLLLKFNDGSIMELSNSEHIGPTDYTYAVTSEGTDYYTHPRYPITKEQITEIVRKEVVKIRIENNVGYFDREIKRNKFSDAIMTLYKAIYIRKQTNNNVYNNF